MHDFTDDINLLSSDTSNTIPQDDQRIEFEDFEEMRKDSDKAFRYY